MKMTVICKIQVFLLMAIIGLSFTSPPSYMEQDDWQLIAQRKVNFVRDKDEIAVTSTQPLTAVRFSAKDRAIGISEVKIHFVNGDKLEPSVDEIIRKGEQSSIIDLGGEKMISKIELKYRTIGSVFKGRADILVYGRIAKTESNQ